MPNEEPDVRAANIGLGAGEMDVVERIQLITASCTLGVILRLSSAGRDSPHGNQAPVIPSLRRYSTKAGPTDHIRTRKRRDKGYRNFERRQ